jgi:hypothetical protein
MKHTQLDQADYIKGLFKKNEKKLAWSFNFTFRYIDDVLLLNNSMFGDFVDRIYPIEPGHLWHRYSKMVHQAFEVMTST